MILEGGNVIVFFFVGSKRFLSICGSFDLSLYSVEKRCVLKISCILNMQPLLIWSFFRVVLHVTFHLNSHWGHIRPVDSVHIWGNNLRSIFGDYFASFDKRTKRTKPNVSPSLKVCALTSSLASVAAS